MDFALGWDPESSKAAHLRLMQNGRFARVCRATTAPPPALSLTKFRRRHLEQGGAGTCWVHAPTQLAEVVMNSRGYESFDVCRRLVGWEGKQLEGGGNPSNGGNGIDALDAMTAEKGAGVAHESLCPYTDSRRVLGTKPPAAVFADAGKAHLEVPVDVTSDDQIVTLLAAGIPTCIGIWWPYGWDDSQTFMSEIGRGSYGHELLICGYAQPGVFDKYAWWQIDNWHGLLYPPLPAEDAAKVPGYTPIQADKTSDFWVRTDVLAHVGSYGDYERVSASDFSGLESKVVSVDWSEAFF